MKPMQIRPEDCHYYQPLLGSIFTPLYRFQTESLLEIPEVHATIWRLCGKTPSSMKNHTPTPPRPETTSSYPISGDDPKKRDPTPFSQNRESQRASTFDRTEPKPPNAWVRIFHQACTKFNTKSVTINVEKHLRQKPSKSNREKREKRKLTYWEEEPTNPR